MTIKIETTDLERRGRNVDAALPPPAPTLFEVAHRRGNALRANRLPAAVVRSAGD